MSAGESAAVAQDTTGARVRFDRGFWFGTGVIALVAFGVRIAAVLGRPNRPAGGDAYYYHQAANLLVAGLGFIDPFHYYGHNLHQHIQMAEWPPLFVGLLAMTSVVGLKTYFAHRIWAGVIGTAAVVVCGLAGREIGGRRVGLITAGIVALYPNIWMSDEPALSETITPLVVGAVLWTAYRFWKRPTMKRAVVLSVVVALTALGRDELTLLFVLLVLPIVLLAKAVPVRQRLVMLSACVLAAVLVLGPWVGFNMSRFSKPVFITTGLGVTLASANCATTWSGQFAGYWSLKCALAAPVDPHADESVQGAEAQSYALHFIMAHKSQWVPVALTKLGRGFGFFRPSQQIIFDSFVEDRPYRWAWVGLYSYYVLFVASIAGAVVLFRRRVTMLPLVAVTLNVVISMIITFGQTRYRTPFEVVLAVLAAVALDGLFNVLSAKRRRAAASAPPTEEHQRYGVPVAV